MNGFCSKCGLLIAYHEGGDCETAKAAEAENRHDDRVNEAFCDRMDKDADEAADRKYAFRDKETDDEADHQ